jgi:transposase
LLHPDANRATSKIFKEFSEEKFPSAILNQTIRDVKAQKKHQQARTFKKMWCSLNNQNLKVEKNGDFYTVSFPTLEKRIGVPVVARPYQQKWLDRIIEGATKQGTAKLYKKKRKWFIALPIPYDVEESQGEKGMGIDLGLRYLAVASVGAQVPLLQRNRCAYIRRRYAARRRKLGKAKKLDDIRKSKDKESRWMKDHNHKISRQIVNFAVANGVGLNRM